MTAARLRLHPPAPSTTVALMLAATLAEALAVVGALRRSGADLMAAEVLDDASRELVPGVPEAAWYLLVEATELEPLADRAGMVVAVSAAEQRRLWAVREGLTEAWAGRRPRPGPWCRSTT